MKIVRFKIENRITYGILENDVVKKIEGDIFSNFSITADHFLFKDIDLLNPVVPPNIIAIGLNYRRHTEESEDNSLHYSYSHRIVDRFMDLCRCAKYLDWFYHYKEI